MHLLGQRKLILLSPCHIVVENVCAYAFHHTILALHPLCILYIYLYAHAYRIARRSIATGIQSQGRGGPVRDPTVGGSRRRRTSAGGTSRVPRS
jgi:hypothetical protein